MLFEIVDILIVMLIDPDEHPSPIKKKSKRARPQKMQYSTSGKYHLGKYDFRLASQYW